MKRHKYLALLLFTAVLLAIVCFHSGMNLRWRVAPPSEMWGRHVALGITEYKKSPSVYTKGKNTVVVFADEKGFQEVETDSKGFILNKKAIVIKEYVPSRLVKYQMGEGKLFWTENYDLFYADLQGSSMNKQKLLSDILDFQLLETDTGIVIVTSTKTAISLYDFGSDGVGNPMGEAQVKDAAIINAARDGKGKLYIAGASRTSPTEYELRVFSYDPSASGFVEKVEPVIIENYSTTREGSNSMNNLELGFDEKDVYVFYEIGKASSQGMIARTYMGCFPKASNRIEKLTFERFRLEEDREEDTYISSLECLDNEEDNLSMIMTTPISTAIGREGSELIYVVMEEGRITYKSIATNTGQWNSFASINRLEGQYVATFLQTIGGTRYIVNLTSTGEEYKENLNRTTMNDVKSAVMDTVGAYVFSSFAIFINLITVSFILLWPITVDFFEWKYFFNNPIVTFRIGALAETFMMYFSIARIYRSKESVAFMPDLLKHGLSPIAILLATAGISYLIVRLYRKSKLDLHSFTELALFILIHNIFVYFLYTAYIARF